jgi:hypothetical protein
MKRYLAARRSLLLPVMMGLAVVCGLLLALGSMGVVAEPVAYAADTPGAWDVFHTVVVSPSGDLQPGDYVDYILYIANFESHALRIAVVEEITPTSGLIEDWGTSRQLGTAGTFVLGTNSYGTAGTVQYGTGTYEDTYSYQYGVVLTGTLGQFSTVRLVIHSRVRGTFEGGDILNNYRIWIWDPNEEEEPDATVDSASIHVKAPAPPNRVYIPIVIRNAS